MRFHRTATRKKLVEVMSLGDGAMSVTQLTQLMYGDLDPNFAKYTLSALKGLEKFGIVKQVKSGKPCHPSRWRLRMR